MTSELWELHMDTTRVYMSTKVAVPYMSKVQDGIERRAC